MATLLLTAGLTRLGTAAVAAGAVGSGLLVAALPLVAQQPALFTGDVRYNISYGRPDASDAQIVAAARAAHADEFIERLPDGYASHLGEQGVRLSGGQRQRIAIVRLPRQQNG